LQDILDNAVEIESYVAGMDFEGYLHSRTTKLAVERLLQMLTEAAIRLGDSAEVYCPNIDWRELRGLGNFIRHAYHRIDDDLIWKTLQNRLPPLKIAVFKALKANP
jgi:uncharacterized protein with HEPN domain